MSFEASVYFYSPAGLDKSSNSLTRLSEKSRFLLRINNYYPGRGVLVTRRSQGAGAKKAGRILPAATAKKSPAARNLLPQWGLLALFPRSIQSKEAMAPKKGRAQQFADLEERPVKGNIP